MSEYYLADHKAEERARERVGDQGRQVGQSQDMKVTLLGDFLFPTSEPQGFDPYNSVQGVAVRDTWRATRRRR